MQHDDQECLDDVGHHPPSSLASDRLSLYFTISENCRATTSDSENIDDDDDDCLVARVTEAWLVDAIGQTVTGRLPWHEVRRRYPQESCLQSSWFAALGPARLLELIRGSLLPRIALLIVDDEGPPPAHCTAEPTNEGDDSGGIVRAAAEVEREKAEIMDGSNPRYCERSLVTTIEREMWDHDADASAAKNEGSLRDDAAVVRMVQQRRTRNSTCLGAIITLETDDDDDDGDGDGHAVSSNINSSAGRHDDYIPFVTPDGSAAAEDKCERERHSQHNHSSEEEQVQQQSAVDENGTPDMPKSAPFSILPPTVLPLVNDDIGLMLVDELVEEIRSDQRQCCKNISSHHHSEASGEPPLNSKSLETLQCVSETPAIPHSQDSLGTQRHEANAQQQRFDRAARQKGWVVGGGGGETDQFTCTISRRKQNQETGTVLDSGASFVTSIGNEEWLVDAIRHATTDGRLPWEHVLCRYREKACPLSTVFMALGPETLSDLVWTLSAVAPVERGGQGDKEKRDLVDNTATATPNADGNTEPTALEVPDVLERSDGDETEEAAAPLTGRSVHAIIPDHSRRPSRMMGPPPPLVENHAHNVVDHESSRSKRVKKHAHILRDSPRTTHSWQHERLKERLLEMVSGSPDQRILFGDVEAGYEAVFGEVLNCRQHGYASLKKLIKDGTELERRKDKHGSYYLQLKKRPDKNQDDQEALKAVQAKAAIERLIETPTLYAALLDVLQAYPEGATCSQVVKGVNGLVYFFAGVAREAGVSHISPASVLRQCIGVTCREVGGKSLFFLDGSSIGGDVPDRTSSGRIQEAEECIQNAAVEEIVVPDCWVGQYEAATSCLQSSHHPKPELWWPTDSMQSLPQLETQTVGSCETPLGFRSLKFALVEQELRRAGSKIGIPRANSGENLSSLWRPVVPDCWEDESESEAKLLCQRTVQAADDLCLPSPAQQKAHWDDADGDDNMLPSLQDELVKERCLLYSFDENRTDHRNVVEMDMEGLRQASKLCAAVTSVFEKSQTHDGEEAAYNSTSCELSVKEDRKEATVLSLRSAPLSPHIYLRPSNTMRPPPLQAFDTDLCLRPSSTMRPPPPRTEVQVTSTSGYTRKSKTKKALQKFRATLQRQEQCARARNTR